MVFDHALNKFIAFISFLNQNVQGLLACQLVLDQENYVDNPLSWTNLFTIHHMAILSKKPHLNTLVTISSMQYAPSSYSAASDYDVRMKHQDVYPPLFKDCQNSCIHVIQL
jgi:hypothetical protein